jgi:hypothetical protein
MLFAPVTTHLYFYLHHPFTAFLVSSILTSVVALQKGNNQEIRQIKHNGVKKIMEELGKRVNLVSENPVHVAFQLISQSPADIAS